MLEILDSLASHSFSALLPAQLFAAGAQPAGYARGVRLVLCRLSLAAARAFLVFISSHFPNNQVEIISTLLRNQFLHHNMDLDNRHKPFIWRKKYEEQGIEIDEKKIAEEYKRKAEANRIELEKIRERQKKRELEYQQRVNDHEFLQRQKEAELHEHWEQQEDDFILRQHRHRSKIRIRDGRAKPIDLFAHYIDISGEKPESYKQKNKGYLQEEEVDLSECPMELKNPCDWFNGLRQSDLDSLESDIRIYMAADCAGNQQYWKDLIDITRNELVKLQTAKEEAAAKDINPAIIADVMSMFEGKSIEELDRMEKELELALEEDDPSIDSSFYKSSLLRLRAFRAQARLTAQHKRFESTKSSLLETRASKEEKKEESVDGDSKETVKSKAGESEEEEEDKDEDDESNKLEDAVEEYKKGNYSPRKLSQDQLEPGIVCVEFLKELELLNRQRNKVCSGSSLNDQPTAPMSQEERDFVKAASKGMDDREESAFSCEAPIRGADNRAQTYIWADKYQPRKPRYFNRVHTGFEWNKYNQTHYDIDNPPPKVVQGYKFNIFYPDLIDKSKAPKFTTTPCKDDRDFCVIRFSAGPPYEDIAFRIVNRDWNNSHKSGYRCQFINNMLQLWFQFKRYRYRR